MNPVRAQFIFQYSIRDAALSISAHFTFFSVGFSFNTLLEMPLGRGGAGHDGDTCGSFNTLLEMPLTLAPAIVAVISMATRSFNTLLEMKLEGDYIAINLPDELSILY